MPESYQQIGEKKDCSINNQVTYPLFISNEFINFWESIWIFKIFILVDYLLHLIIYGTIIFVDNLLITSTLLSWKICFWHL